MFATAYNNIVPRKLDPRPVIFSVHGAQPAITRNVPRAECERIIKHGPTWDADGVGHLSEPRWKARGYYDNRDVVVVFVETTDGAIEVLEVVTVKRNPATLSQRAWAVT